jgi:hypothetical protein
VPEFTVSPVPFDLEGNPCAMCDEPAEVLVTSGRASVMVCGLHLSNLTDQSEEE